MRNDDDISIWRACMAGSRNAFEVLYKRYFPLLYAYGLKLISDRELIQDTIQDLFVKLMQDGEKLSSVINFRTYIYSAFRNKLLDTLRQSKITYEISEYEEAFTVENVFEGLFKEDDIEKEKVRKLLTAYKLLPVRQQEILYLFYVKELKHEEIAKVLNINSQSSKNLLFRAICKLRSCFSLK